MRKWPPNRWSISCFLNRSPLKIRQRSALHDWVHEQGCPVAVTPVRVTIWREWLFWQYQNHLLFKPICYSDKISASVTVTGRPCRNVAFSHWNTYLFSLDWASKIASSIGGFLSGERFKKHEIDHRFCRNLPCGQSDVMRTSTPWNFVSSDFIFTSIDLTWSYPNS